MNPYARELTFVYTSASRSAGRFVLVSVGVVDRASPISPTKIWSARGTRKIRCRSESRAANGGDGGLSAFGPKGGARHRERQYRHRRTRGVRSAAVISAVVGKHFLLDHRKRLGGRRSSGCVRRFDFCARAVGSRTLTHVLACTSADKKFQEALFS